MRRQNTLVASLLATALLAGSPVTLAKKHKSQDDEQWSEWQAMASGYVARRKQPRKIDEPVAERHLDEVQERDKELKKQKKRKLAKAEKKSKAGKKSAAEQKELATLDARIAAAEKEQKKASKDKTPKAAAWLYTGTAGLHEVTIADAAAQLGESESKLRNKARAGAMLLSRGKNANSKAANHPVAWHFDEATDSLLFAAQAYDTFHSDQNAYRLRYGNKKSKQALPMAVTGSKAFGGDAQPQPFRDTLKFEEEPDMMFLTWVVADEQDADYWFWDYLYAGSRNVLELPLAIPYPAAEGSAELRVTLRGFTDLGIAGEHEVHAQLNGQPVGSVVWEGMTKGVLVAEFDQGLLDPEGDNTLRLDIVYQPGTTPGQFLDEIEVDYQRQPVAVADSLWLYKAAGGGQSVGGFTSQDIMVIESPAGVAKVRDNARVEEDGMGGWQVSFKARAGKDYLVAARASGQAPIMAPDYASALNKAQNRADYLIIAPRDFAGTAQALAEYRQERYGEVKIAWLGDIYDEYSAGREDPAAIGRFMKRVVRAWDLAPEAVSLVGKPSLDQKNRMGYSDGFLPAMLVSTPWSLASSDSRLLGYTDNAPFLIGRLPIVNDAEGLAYIDKLAAYEAGGASPQRYEALLIADNPDQAGDFHRNSDSTAQRLTDEMGFDQVDKLYHPLDDVSEALLLSETWEKGFVSYDGHGSTAQAGDFRENFILASEVATLNNTERPIFAALTCAVGDDTYPGTRSVAGALVLNPNGGAIASLAPTGLSLDADAQLMAEVFIDGLFIEGTTIGRAAQDAKSLTSGTIRPFMSRMYGVVGEPTVYAR